MRPNDHFREVASESGACPTRWCREELGKFIACFHPVSWWNGETSSIRHGGRRSLAPCSPFPPTHNKQCIYKLFSRKARLPSVSRGIRDRGAIYEGYRTWRTRTGVSPSTDGYFLDGIGARSKALAGAGVADGTDATSAALNPAGIVHAQDEADLSASVFLPFREFTAAGETLESDRNAFLLPNIAVNWRTVGNPYLDAVTLSLSGNGGMNTTYPAGANIFGAGKAGVDLQQMLLSVALAKKFGNVSVGVAPVFGVADLQRRRLGSLQRSVQRSFGSDQSREGPRIRRWPTGWRRMGRHFFVPNRCCRQHTDLVEPVGRYQGLFADQGDFDIPANIQAGIAVDVSPTVTLLLDYRRIWFSETNSVGDPSTLLLAGVPLGATNGPGFGWNDVDAIKAGIEWKYSPDLTLRAGYSYNTQPINSRDVELKTFRLRRSCSITSRVASRTAGPTASILNWLRCTRRASMFPVRSSRLGSDIPAARSTSAWNSSKLRLDSNTGSAMPPRR